MESTNNTQVESHTRLHGRWLFLARLAWAIGFITLTAMYALGFLEVRVVLSTVCDEESCTLYQQIRHTKGGEQVVDWGGPPIGFADPLYADQVKALERLGLTLDQYGWLAALQMGIPALVYLLIAAGLFWRKSDDWMVLFVSTMVMMFPLVDMPLPFTLAVRQPVWEWVHIPARFLALCSWFIWPLVFPTGRFVPRWIRWKIFFDIAFAAIGPLRRILFWEPPGWGDFVYIYVLLSFCINVYAQAYRYFRVASPVERQQIKWVFVGLMIYISIAFMLVEWNGQFVSQAGSMEPARALILSVIRDTLFRAVALFIPLSIAISVLRYRLWDIDIIISRTLVYGALTACIVALYILLVGTLSLLSQTTDNLLISLLATGLIAFLFQPLRERLQRGVNRLLYGDRDEPYAALSRLGRRLEAAYAPESVLPTIVETVAQTLKLPYVAIALNQGGEFKIAAEFGRSESEPINLPLTYQAEPVGELILAPRAPGEHFTVAERQLLDDLARQAGVATHAVRLTADLQHSREQLVLTREEERRRLRRDLHDGLGPNLAGQGLKLAAVKQLLENNPTAIIPLLDQVMAQNKSTVEDVRRLVYGLRPPSLDELGLVSAIRDHVAGMDGISALQIEITEPEGGLPALSAAVEVAAYRIVLEALTNVIRHAQAKHCAIRFSVSDNGSSDILEIEIQDDGRGMPNVHRAGVGIRSMRERAKELGGTCVIESNTRQGTCVSVTVPLIAM